LSGDKVYMALRSGPREGKNGAVIRKLIGYGNIASHHAEGVQKFHTAYLNPYLTGPLYGGLSLNFHRPSGFATVSLDARGSAWPSRK
jgi:hypothetical protein